MEGRLMTMHIMVLVYSRAIYNFILFNQLWALELEVQSTKRLDWDGYKVFNYGNMYRIINSFGRVINKMGAGVLQMCFWESPGLT